MWFWSGIHNPKYVCMCWSNGIWITERNETWNHTRNANKQTACLSFSLLFRCQSDMSRDKCAGIFQNEKFTHTFHAYNNNNLYTFIRFLQQFTCWLNGCSTDTHHNTTFSLHFASHFLVGILRENFMTSREKKTSRRIKGNAKKWNTL